MLKLRSYCTMFRATVKQEFDIKFVTIITTTEVVVCTTPIRGCCRLSPYKGR